MLLCMYCDQTTDEREVMLREGDTAEVCPGLPTSFTTPPPPILDTSVKIPSFCNWHAFEVQARVWERSFV